MSAKLSLFFSLFFIFLLFPTLQWSKSSSSNFSDDFSPVLLQMAICAHREPAQFLRIFSLWTLFIYPSAFATRWARETAIRSGIFAFAKTAGCREPAYPFPRGLSADAYAYSGVFEVFISGLCSSNFFLFSAFLFFSYSSSTLIGHA